MKATASLQSVEAIGPRDLEIALSKARAARILLGANADYLQIPVSLNPGESEEEIRGWIQSFAFEALDAALQEAEAAREKILGPPQFGQRKGGA
jgi:hypothetical protein